jgi:CRP/FNR family transcriptional regulator, cyclic AMP receptor protein
MAAIAFMQNSILCRNLEPDTLAKLMSAGVVGDHASGTAICNEGDTDDTLYVILEGKVEIRRQHQGKSVEIATLERQAIFGERAVLTGRPRSATISARIDCRIIEFPGNIVRDVANLAPKFGWLLASLMAGRTKDTEKKLGL